MFEWEESLFLGVKSVYERVFVAPEKRRVAAVGIGLSELRGELLWLGQLIAGRPLTLFETDTEALRCGDRVFLPTRIALSDSIDENAELFRLKTIVASLSIREEWKEEGADALGDRVYACGSEFPHLEERLRAAEGLFEGEEGDLWEWFGVISEDENVMDEKSLEDSEKALEEKWGEGVTEIEGKGRIGVEEIEELGDVVEEDLPMHTFEKAETLEEYTGLNRKVDGDDELEDHKEALDKLNMSSILRSHERPGSIYRSDVMLANGDWLSLSEKPGTGIPYREWDYKKRRYEEDWCYVNPGRFDFGKPEWLEETEQRTRAVTRRLKKHLANVVNERMHAKRQPLGDEFDLNAVVDAMVDLRLGTTPGEQLYVDRKRQLPDLLPLILLDYSYSTDAYIENHRALDVIRDSVFSIGETFEGYLDRFGIAGFSSNTRRACSFRGVKGFRESWKAARGRLGGVAPGGYTRIGPALRHGASLLKKEEAGRKVIVLLTDGRPCDYDRYEGTYGIKDVRKAIEEAKLEGIDVYAFAIEKRASETFPMMFDAGHFHALEHPRELPETMLKVFERMMVR